MANRRERGENKLGCALSLVILAAAVIIAIKAVPVRLAVAELDDYCTNAVERAPFRREQSGKTIEEQIAEDILAKATSEHLPVKMENIRVWRDTEEEHCEVKYRVAIDLLVTQYNWDVVHSADRKRF